MNIFPSNSCVYAVTVRPEQAGYALAGLRSAPPVVVLGADFGAQDIVQAVHTLNQKQFLYGFGRAVTDGTFQCVVLLGYAGASGMASFVNAIRTSRNTGGVSLSTPFGGFKVHVTGWRVSVPDAEFNLQPFGIPFKLAA